MSLPEWGEHFSFKGGTSLSKGWKIIERFSEDIDIVIDRAWLGFPEDSLSSHKQGRLRDKCESSVQEIILPLLKSVFEEKLSGNRKLRKAEGSEGDKGTLIFEYPGVLLSDVGYLRPHVKLEFGGRADTEPWDMMSIQSFLNEEFPQPVGEGHFTVRTVLPKRTFWEKALLLHEENSRPEREIRDRLSRHYYDLWAMIVKGVADEALEDVDLFNKVVEHRKVFYKIGSLDYSLMAKGSLSICPSAERRSAWEKDYNDMKAEMFHGKPPSFEEVLEVIAEAEKRFNQ